MCGRVWVCVCVCVCMRALVLCSLRSCSCSVFRRQKKKECGAQDDPTRIAAKTRYAAMWTLFCLHVFCPGSGSLPSLICALSFVLFVLVSFFRFFFRFYDSLRRGAMTSSALEISSAAVRTDTKHRQHGVSKQLHFFNCFLKKSTTEPTALCEPPPSLPLPRPRPVPRSTQKGPFLCQPHQSFILPIQIRPRWRQRRQRLCNNFAL